MRDVRIKISKAGARRLKAKGCERETNEDIVEADSAVVTGWREE